jgi:hypothetical protein
MRVSLPIDRDSDNSYPSAELEIDIYDDTVAIRISDADRVIAVRREDFEQVARLLFKPHKKGSK